MTGGPVTPTRPDGSSRRLRTALILAVGVVIIVALTATLAYFTAPDSDSEATPPPALPVITDQQARDIAEVLTRSMFEISPATADAQIATFKATSCGDLTTEALPNVIEFTDQSKAQNRSSTITFDSIGVTPRPAAAPTAEVLVAGSWKSGETVNQTRIVYEVIVQNGKTCIAKAQFL